MQSTREVASGVVNLGSTCYMNAVLQALAHSPELCSAIDCESHCKDCPIAISNTIKQEQKNNTNRIMNNKDSDEDDTLFQNDTVNSNASAKESKDENLNGSHNGNNGVNSDDNSQHLEEEFCLLCEMEKHLIEVHNRGSTGDDESSSSNNTNNNNNNSNTNRGPVSPSAFVNGFISNVAPGFKLGVQEDSHEFLRLLIEAMQKSCLTNKGRNKGDDNNYTTTTTNNDIHKITVHNRNEYAFKLFRGTVQSIVKCCNCKSISSTIDPIEDIGLEVTSNPSLNAISSKSRGGRLSPSPSALLDVKNALEKFVTTEKLDSGYKCETCEKVGQATKQSRLASIPPILTLHLKRFRYGNDRGNGFAQQALPSRRRNNEVSLLLGNGDIGTSGSAKIEGHVKFDMILDIRPYLTEEKQKEVGCSMLSRLFAVVVHSGKNSHSGHYICYVRNVAKNEWWKMDDAKVTRVLTNEVTAAEAYLLFYRVVDHPVSVELRNKEIAMKEEVAAREKAESEAREKQQKLNESEMKSKKPNKRKRDEPTYKSVNDWACKVPNLPESWIPFLQKIEEVISDQLQFKTEYINLLEDEAKAGGKLGDVPSVGIDVNDVQGGIDNYREAMIELFKSVLPTQKDLIHDILNSVKLDGDLKEKESIEQDKKDSIQNEDAPNNESDELHGIISETDTFLFQFDDSNDNML